MKGVNSYVHGMYSCVYINVTENISPKIILSQAIEIFGIVDICAFFLSYRFIFRVQLRNLTSGSRRGAAADESGETVASTLDAPAATSSAACSLQPARRRLGLTCMIIRQNLPC